MKIIAKKINNATSVKKGETVKAKYGMRTKEVEVINNPERDREMENMGAEPRVQYFVGKDTDGKLELYSTIGSDISVEMGWQEDEPTKLIKQFMEETGLKAE